MEKKSSLLALNFGIIIYYMLFNEYPYDCKNKSEIIEQIKSNKPLKKSNNRELDDLIKKIFNQRISWDRFISHPFFLQDEVKLPSFNLYCEKHPNEYLICYCPNVNVIFALVVIKNILLNHIKLIYLVILDSMKMKCTF